MKIKSGFGDLLAKEKRFAEILNSLNFELKHKNICTYSLRDTASNKDYAIECLDNKNAKLVVEHIKQSCFNIINEHCMGSVYLDSIVTDFEEAFTLEDRLYKQHNVDEGKPMAEELRKVFEDIHFLYGAAHGVTVNLNKVCLLQKGKTRTDVERD